MRADPASAVSLAQHKAREAFTVDVMELQVKVEALADDTALAGIQRLVEEAQASQSRAQALADRIKQALTSGV